MITWRPKSSTLFSSACGVVLRSMLSNFPSRIWMVAATGSFSPGSSTRSLRTERSLLDMRLVFQMCPLVDPPAEHEPLVLGDAGLVRHGHGFREHRSFLDPGRERLDPLDSLEAHASRHRAESGIRRMRRVANQAPGLD